MFRTRIGAADGLVLLAVALLAALLFALPWLREDGASLIVSTPDGSEVYPLAEDRLILLSAGGVSLTVEIAGGRARVKQSDCPDGVCVARQTLDPGDIASGAVVAVPSPLSGVYLVKICCGGEWHTSKIVAHE